MHIVGRLALQSVEAVPGSAPSPMAQDMRRQGYHGYDVVVRTLSEHDFEADMATDLPKGALVRLRLPGAGMMVAHVIRSQRGRLCAKFVNPVSPARLGKTLGWMAASATA